LGVPKGIDIGNGVAIGLSDVIRIIDMVLSVAQEVDLVMLHELLKKAMETVNNR
jgi:hypothetical protein